MAATKQRDNYTFEQCACAFVRFRRRQSFRGTPLNMSSALLPAGLEDLTGRTGARGRVTKLPPGHHHLCGPHSRQGPPSRTNLLNYHIADYKIWCARLAGLIGVSVSGINYTSVRPGRAEVSATLGTIDEELPGKLRSWLQNLSEQLSGEWYKKLPPAEANIWYL